MDAPVYQGMFVSLFQGKLKCTKKKKNTFSCSYIKFKLEYPTEDLLSRYDPTGKNSTNVAFLVLPDAGLRFTL